MELLSGDLMQMIELRPVPQASFEVTDMGLGGSPLGNRSRPMSEAEADDIVEAAWAAGIRYFDTAPLYGHGLAEARLGRNLRWKPRDEFVVSSKVGRVLRPAARASIDYGPWADGLPFACHFDYSYDGTMRSFEDSLQRLGLERIDMVFIHDIDVFTHGPAGQKLAFEQAMDGCYRALLRLREEGAIKAIGVGVNEWEPCVAALDRGDFDCFLLAGRYSLLDQSALDRFLPLCVERKAAVVIGGGFNSGILATGAVAGASYNYEAAPEPILAKIRRMEIVCQRYDVSLPAVALQFVLTHPAVASNIPGARSAAQLRQNIAWAGERVPADLWAELKAERLLRDDAPVPGGRSALLDPTPTG